MYKAAYEATKQACLKPGQTDVGWARIDFERVGGEGA